MCIEVRAHHMADRVNQTQPLEERHAGQTRAHLHPTASDQITRLLNGAGQPASNERQRLQRHPVTHRMIIRHAVGLDGVHHGIDTRPGR